MVDATEDIDELIDGSVPSVYCSMSSRSLEVADVSDGMSLSTYIIASYPQIKSILSAASTTALRQSNSQSDRQREDVNVAVYLQHRPTGTQSCGADTIERDTTDASSSGLQSLRQVVLPIFFLIR